MGTYVDVNDPNGVAAVGALLRAKADALAAQAKQVLGDIQSHEAGAPWGADQVGADFLKNYQQTPQGGGTAFDQSLKDELAGAGQDLARTGDGVMMAMVNFQGTDNGNAADIRGTTAV